MLSLLTTPWLLKFSSGVTALASVFALLLLFQTPDVANNYYKLEDQGLASELPIIQGQLSLIRECLLDHVLDKENRTWRWLSLIIPQCVQQYLPLLNVLTFATDKVFLGLRHNSTQHPCAAVTLGIGNDTIMEEQLKLYYPHCKLYGADPVQEIGGRYARVGKFYKTAVDATTERRTLSVMGKSKTYGWQDIDTISLAKFLRENVQESVIHFLSMDIEGAEYRILPYISSGEFQLELDDYKVVICQMMLELHGPIQNYGVSKLQFDKILYGMLSRSPFMPVRIYTPLNHHRFLVLNTQDKECLEDIDILGSSKYSSRLSIVNYMKQPRIQTIMQVVMPEEED